jgi:subtilisin family serine protease
VKKAVEEARNEVRQDMMRSIITEPLLGDLRDAVEAGKLDAEFDVIISLNELFYGGIPEALKWVRQRADEWKVPYSQSSHYVFGRLSAGQLLVLAEEARSLIAKEGMQGSVIYRIWEDSEVEVSLTRSLTTIKADAAQRSFQAWGEGIVWAVMDSGIDGTHPHFHQTAGPFGPWENLSAPDPVKHMDFTPMADNANGSALQDAFGHGTHVAGIIGGAWQSASPDGDPVGGAEVRNESTNEAMPQRQKLVKVTSVAPRCRLVSLKVIADQTVAGDRKQTAGQGKVSWVLLAIEQIQQWNQYGKRLLVHGVNMSLGYDFDPRWFACGNSPICVEVNRLVKCGVSVVVSAGNSGYATMLQANNRPITRYNDISITDPGNADLAITVGATHREMPHLYGISYFSSRGPTGDGRLKPDLVAPGERIISCASGAEAAKYADATMAKVLYCEQTGTSMAAPHVSGAIAAFLSVRREFIGQPERVKEIFLANTIDLRRDRTFQGAGLLDLMKVLQAV